MSDEGRHGHGVAMKRSVKDEQTLLLLSDEHRAEWKRLERISRSGGALESWISIVSFIASVALAPSTVLSLALDPLSGQFIILGAVTVAVFFGGPALARLLGQRAKARAQVRMSELREVARKFPVMRPRQNQSSERSNDYNDGTNYKKYPVTGTYNPTLYHERGGRSTAAAMANWGVDYETYRSNIE